MSTHVPPPAAADHYPTPSLPHEADALAATPFAALLALSSSDLT